MQASDPGQLGVNLLNQVADHLSAIDSQIHVLPQRSQLLFSALQVAFSLFEDARANWCFEHLEHSDSRDKTRPRGRIRFAEFAQACYQLTPSECSDCVLLTRLATLSRHGLFAYPALGGEVAQQRINQIVVHRALPQNESSLAFQLVSMLRTFEKGG